MSSELFKTEYGYHKTIVPTINTAMLKTIMLHTTAPGMYLRATNVEKVRAKG
jgi:hypothetical protein